MRERGIDMLNRGLSRKEEDQPQISQPMNTGPSIKTNATTDNKDLSVIIDGDKFNVNAPKPVSNPIITIPGYGVNGSLDTLEFNKQMLSTHVAMVGGIGMGKSNLFNHLISQVRQRMTADDVTIIFDTKGDFLKDFGKPDDIVISNDSQARGSSGSDYWNIFNEIDAEDAEASIREICTSLFKESLEKTSNAFFPNAAADLLYAFITIFHQNWKAQKKRDPTNIDLIAFLRSSTPERLYKTLLGYKFTSIASHIADPKSGQAQGVIAEMNSIINRIFIGNFVKSGTLSMNNIVKQRGGKTVFIEYDIQSGETLTPIYSLLVDMALKQALSNKSEHRGSVYLFVDEFKLLPNLSHIDDAVNFGRSLGMKVFIALQSITQMYDNYGEMRAKSILSGFLNYMFFNVNNAESREFIKARFGKCLRKVNYGTGKDYVYIDDVVKDKDITRLSVGEMIVGLSNCEPFSFKSSEWTRN